MKLVSKIFKREDWYVTSNYGYRNCPFHGKEHHNGTDYGTNKQNWPIYAIEEGYVQKINKSNNGYGNYIWVRYPRINISLMHAHLDSICVKNKQKVKEGTLLGFTGKTGNATGIHLHLGMTKIKSDKWINPHTYNYQPKETKNTTKYIVQKGDSLWSIAKKYYNNGKDYTKIAKANNITKPYTIFPKQELTIP